MNTFGKRRRKYESDFRNGPWPAAEGVARHGYQTHHRQGEGISFNIIQFDIEGRKVLDLFGGTGQLGIEALSRGAARCTFVDMNRQAAAIIRENVAAVGFADRAAVQQGDAMAFLSGCREKYDLIFLDPPYQTQLLENCIQAVAKFDILSEHGIMVCESAQEKQLPELGASYEKGREYRYGKIKLTVYRRQGSSEL